MPCEMVSQDSECLTIGCFISLVRHFSGLIVSLIIKSRSHTIKGCNLNIKIHVNKTVYVSDIA